LLEHGGQAGGVKCISIFKERLSSPTDAISAMTAISDSETIEAGAIATLIQALSHHHPSVRNTAVETLVKLAPATVEPLIAAFLQVAQNQESDKVVRRITVALDQPTLR